jgi:hypothetical protein
MLSHTQTHKPDGDNFFPISISTGDKFLLTGNSHHEMRIGPVGILTDGSGGGN